MEELKTNNEIFQVLGSVVEGIKNINTHLATLNGSVAKQQDKLAAQDVINAQMTISQQQLVKDLSDMTTNTAKKKANLNNFWYGVLSSMFVVILTYLLTKYG